MSKTVLITGASGCVGHYLVEEFLQETEHRLVLVLRDPSRLAESLRGHERVSVIDADMVDLERYAHVIPEIECAVLAAAGWGGPAAFDVNKTANLALAARLAAARCKTVLYFATASVLTRGRDLFPSARDFGTDYIRSKYDLVEGMEALAGRMRIVGLFPTLVLGGSDGTDGRAAKPFSHLARLFQEVQPWFGLVRFLKADGCCHIIHGRDIAVMTRHLVDTTAELSDGPARIVLGNPAMTLNDIVAETGAHLGMRAPFRIELRTALAEFIIKIFRIRLSDWDRYCMANRDQSYPDARSPADFGLPHACPDLRTGLSSIGIR